MPHGLRRPNVRGGGEWVVAVRRPEASVAIERSSSEEHTPTPPPPDCAGEKIRDDEAKVP